VGRRLVVRVETPGPDRGSPWDDRGGRRGGGDDGRRRRAPPRPRKHARRTGVGDDHEGRACRGGQAPGRADTAGQDRE